MLTHRELEQFKKTLRQMRARFDARVDQLREDALTSTGGESAGGISNAPIHLADLGTQESVEVVNIGLAENEASMRREIDAALDRIEAGSYGTCEECEQEINPERLEAIPYARYCIQCANEIEQRERI